MVEDTVKALGYLTLGTRLKRLGERLQSQTQVLLEEAALGLPASYCPFLAALHRLGPISVGELAETIGISQPGVTRVLEKLESEGLVQSRQVAGDRRVRTVALSKSGQQLVSHARRTAWPMIDAAVADACASAAQSLLEQLTALEEALAAAPLTARARRLPRKGTSDARP